MSPLIKSALPLWSLLILFLAAFPAAAVDLDSDGLPDVWQLRYGAQDLLPGDDTDGDGATNAAEATAGTNPFVAMAAPRIEVGSVSPDLSSTVLEFPSARGITYQLHESNSLPDFTPLGPPFLGTGEQSFLNLDSSSGSTVETGAQHDFWADLATWNVTTLTTLPDYPSSPDGTARLAEFDLPRVQATGFGGRVHLMFRPPVTGYYTFTLHSNGPARLVIGGSTQAEITPGMTGPDPGNVPSFTKTNVGLVGGALYSAELIHVNSFPRGRCWVTWSGPGLTGTATFPTGHGESAEFPDGGFAADPPQYFKLTCAQEDQDGDGISDWAEMELARDFPFLFFDAETTNGTPDATAVAPLLPGSPGGPVVISLAASDAAAFEVNTPNPGPDHGEITVFRTGGTQPVTVNLCQLPLLNTGSTATICDGTCCTLVGSAGDEEAEASDYTIIDEEGIPVTDTLDFGWGETSKVLTVIATPDSDYEYPETINIAVAPCTSYDISPTLNGASIQLFDAPDHPDNDVLLTGTFATDGNAVTATSGNGYVTAFLNGPRTELRLWNDFSNLTSAQQDSHVHKANPGPAPGSIIYAITNVPGDESGISPDSDPLNGPLTEYPWDLTASSGAVPTAGGAASRQTIIDSLCGQAGESPLYLNIHTVDNPAGEIWAMLAVTEGSLAGPGAPTPAAAPGSPEFPQLTGDDLEAEVRRFLNQATFGATEDEVTDMIALIESERGSDPGYHRVQAFEAWLDDQMNPAEIPQTYLLDYNLATDWQFFVLAGMFDKLRNPGTIENPTPAKPLSWPTVDRTDPDPALWHLSDIYPVTRDNLSLDSMNGLRTPGNTNRRIANWQMMFTARDQLRQKVGFALQQIVVVSAESDILRSASYGCSNYQDLLNRHAFGHYRDVLGSVNWSPIMAHWLSSLQNQKAFDVDDDGFPDIFPDENLARENMQLFSIGLFELWPDGSLKLGPNGLPIPTYTNDDIQEFAKILTGQSFSRRNNVYGGELWGGLPWASQPENNNFSGGQFPYSLLSSNYLYPLKMFGDRHDTTVKTFAGTTIDNTSLIADPEDPTEEELVAMGIADIEAAMDWLAGKPGDGQPDFDMTHSHRSTPAFISRRLIQRFVTSNPSREYLHRVATVFKDSEGDLGLTMRAILLDPEARVFDLDDHTFGNKKSPLEGFIQLVRALDGFTLIPLTDPSGAYPFDTAPGDFTQQNLYLENFGYPAAQLANHTSNFRPLFNTTVTSGSRGMQMTPFRQETVFNWYLPDYSPGGPVSAAGLVAPEMQLANEQDIIRNINWFEDLTRTTNGISMLSMADSTENQQLAFNSDDSVDGNDRLILDLQLLADTFYPAVEPTATAERTSESLADEALLDELDRRLTYGFFKQRYPYDPSDDDDPSIPGVDDLRKNPRELIIDALTDGYSDPYNGSNDENDRRNKLQDALYLLTFSPEYQIRK